MAFAKTSDQILLRNSLSALLAKSYDFSSNVGELHRAWRPDVWTALVEELGLLGATFPEERGGFGAGPSEISLIMHEFGRSLARLPYLSTIVIGGELFSQLHESRADDIDRLASGSMILAAALLEARGGYDWADVDCRAEHVEGGYRLSGRKVLVTGGPIATHYLVSARLAGARTSPDGLSLFLVAADADGIARRDYRTIDAVETSDITFDDVEIGDACLIGMEGEAEPTLKSVLDTAIAAQCAEMVGVMRRLYELTVDYVRQREQFGRPIAEFQVVQHRLSAMLVEVEQAQACAIGCIVKLKSEPDERSRMLSAAKYRVGRACKFVAKNAVQLHGAIGTTDESVVSHYFKRAVVLEKSLGSSDYHLKLFMKSYSPYIQ